MFVGEYSSNAGGHRRSSLAPGAAGVHSLPNELLEIIFKLGAHIPLLTDEHYPYRPLFSKLPLHPLFATSVSQVCVRWRTLALQTPTLWSTLYISRSAEAYRRLKTDLRRSLEWVPTYIQRSGELPLDITLDCTRVPLGSAAVIPLLVPHSERWRTLTILVSHVGNLPSALTFFERIHVPALECLAVAADIYREGIISTQPLPVFFTSGAPRLSALKLKGVYLAWNGPPLLGLTTLELRFSTRWPAFEELRDMFDASPALKRLIIQDEIASVLRNVEQRASTPTVELPQLEYLEIEVYRVRQGEADVTGLLRLFSVPMLETLALKGLRASEWASIAAYFKERRNAIDFPTVNNLLLLEVESYRQSTSLDFDSCEAFPRLMHLSLTHTRSDLFLHLLQGDDNGNRSLHVWPYLQRLTILHDEHFSVPLLQRVVDARQLLGRPSLTLILDNMVPFEQSELERLKRHAVVSFSD